MTRPMPVLPGTPYMESRRCFQRRYLLRPSKRTNQIVLYCLAYAAEMFEVELHGFCAESNHIHEVSTDTQGNHPEFRQLKNSLIARAMNAELGRRESFWSPTDRESMVLADEGAQIDAYAYTLANPVKDGLVTYGYQWPGGRSRPSDIGKAFIIKRPKGRFFSKSTLPEEVTLRLTMLPALRHLPHDEAIALLDKAVADKEAAGRKACQKAGRPVLGRRAVRKQSPFEAPKGPTPFRRLNPRIKCSDRSLRKRLLQRLKAFWQAYADARRAWREGRAPTPFPLGTYQLRVLYGVPTVAG